MFVLFFKYLRKRLIGKSVLVHIDFVRPAEGEFEERECATIKFGRQNKYVHLECLSLDDLGTRAGSSGSQPAGNGMYTM